MEGKAIWLRTSRSKFSGFSVCLMNPRLIGREVREPQKFNHIQTKSTGNEQPHIHLFPLLQGTHGPHHYLQGHSRSPGLPPHTNGTQVSLCVYIKEE